MVSFLAWPGSWPGLTWQDELGLRIIGGGNLLAGRRLVDQLAQPVNRGEAAEAVMRPSPIVEVLPFGQLGIQFRSLQIDSRPKLLECRLLHPLHLAVEIGRGGPDGPKLDAPDLQLVLDPIGEELLPSARLMR